ncbi:MAG: hypothetical protein KC417_07065, partial [Myxococcales bacterium]|nr:hypothetical protein [Myxococcales bacterium]
KGSLEATLAADPGVHQVAQDPDDDTLERFFRAYFPRRFAVWPLTPEAIRAQLTPEGLTERARTLRSALASPLGATVARLAPADPLQAYDAWLSKMRAEFAAPTNEGSHRAVVSFTTRASAFDATEAARLESLIERWAARAKASGHLVRISQSAIHRFTVRAERSIRRDLTVVSIGSTVLLVAVFLGVFRSLGVLVRVAVPTLMGLAAGLGVTTLAFGEVHGATLAFGGALTGACVDYVAHMLVHFDDVEGRPAAVRGVWIGAGTTVLGLAAFGGGALPGFLEMAVFACTGVAVAALASVVVVRGFGVGSAARSAVPRLAERAESVLVARRPVLRWAGVTLAGVALAASTGLVRLDWATSLRDLIASDASLVREDAEVRRGVGRLDASRFIVVHASTVDGALQANDAAYAALAPLVGHAVESIRSVAPLLPSVRTQRARLTALGRGADLRERVERAFASEGFEPGAFEPFAADLATPASPITWSDLERGGLVRWVEPFRFPFGDEVAFVTYLGGVHDLDAVQRAVARAGKGVEFIDQNRFFEAAYARMRSRVLTLVALGFAAVLLLVAVRYRTWKALAYGVLPPLLASVAVLGGLGYVGASANVLHLFGALLVLCMGVDYGVFLAELARGGARTIGRTVVGIAIASGTTTATFGLLAMSANPVLASVGIVVAVGLPLTAALSVFGFAAIGGSEEGR